MRCFEVRGDSVEVDDDTHAMMNELANQFYQTGNAIDKPGFDFSASSHPEERRMYLMALTAYLYHLNVGLD